VVDNYYDETFDSTNYSFLYAGGVPYSSVTPVAAPTDAPPPTSPSSDSGVHSLSSRFTHRTSLFSYHVLNRASVR